MLESFLAFSGPIIPSPHKLAGALHSLHSQYRCQYWRELNEPYSQKTVVVGSDLLGGSWRPSSKGLPLSHLPQNSPRTQGATQGAFVKNNLKAKCIY